MTARRFDGKHALITGGGRGIGLEIARHFGREGARVHLFDIEAALLDDACRRLGREGIAATGTRVDVCNQAEVSAAVEAVDAQAPLDVLVNNAGIARETPFLKIDESEWRRILDVNLTGMFFVAQAVARRMVTRRHGAIVNMASKNGLFGEVGYAHYNASKGGAVMLTKTMALELAPVGIRVNAVAPGYVQTPMSAEIDSPEFTRDFVERYIPLDRPAKVDEIAPLFLFLASDDARFITGEVIVVDGGQMAGQKPGPELRARML
jgi:3-oxoacyl-[acyl-carrier protein] reductase